MSGSHTPVIAQALLNAYTTKQPIEPITDTYAQMSVEEAYNIQLAQLEQWIAAGRKVTGFKVGLTSRAMQVQLGISEPDFGHVFADVAFSDGEQLDLNSFISPRIEPEIAIVLSKDLKGPGITVEDVLDSVEGVVPALEIIDSRIAGWRIRLADTVADNASFGAYVLGTEIRPLDTVDLVNTRGTLTRNGIEVGAGLGSEVLGSSLNSVVWLANTMGELGTPLRAGNVVLPGSICAASQVSPGDTFTATFSGIGSVSVGWLGLSERP